MPTRRHVLRRSRAWPHVGLRMVWPLGVAMRALISTSDAEVRSCLQILQATHAGTA